MRQVPVEAVAAKFTVVSGALLVSFSFWQENNPMLSITKRSVVFIVLVLVMEELISNIKITNNLNIVCKGLLKTLVIFLTKHVRVHKCYRLNAPTIIQPSFTY